MPQHEQTIVLNETDREKALAFCYLAFKKLGWDILYAGADSLLGSTPKNWNTKGQQIVCRFESGVVTIKSEMVNGEMLDIGRRNKKNVAEWINAFEAVRATGDENTVDSAKKALISLREATIQTAAQQEQEAIEVDRAMNLSNSNLYVTYTIIAINVLVFVLMAMNGAGIVEANGYVHIQWGSNYSFLTLSGDWWRLLSNIFIHFGVIHLLMNMYCLYTVGVYLEPMLGKLRYSAAYLCTGVLASVTSLWWHKEGVNSAGASGAVFGIYGVFLALLTSNLIPQKVRQALLQSIVIFVGYNLLYGMKTGVDNSAHIGGLLSGFIIGYAYILGIKKEKQQEQKIKWIAPAVLLITVLIAFLYLDQNKVSVQKRARVSEQVKAALYKDNDKFNEALSRFDKLHEEINTFLADTSLTYEQLNIKLTEIGFPKLQEAEQIVRSTGAYDISPASHSKAEKLLQYIGLKKHELEILKQICETRKEAELIPVLNDTRQKANSLFLSLVSQ